ncbi:MAG: methyl-accepting chemotaxis protein [Pseudomonadota bacterium]
MNMMTLQNERDDHKASSFTQELQDELATEPADSEPSSSGDKGILLGRLAWFRNMRVANKIRTIFGTFFGVTLTMLLILGFGLSDLWSRDQVSNEVRQAVVSSTDLRGTTGELRYNSVRYIFGQEAVALERQRDSFEAAKAQVAMLNGIISTHVPDLTEPLDTIHADLEAYNATFEELKVNLEAEGRSERSTELAYVLSDQGDALFEKSRELAIELARRGQDGREKGIDYFFDMITVIGGLIAIAVLVLVAGLRYLTRDFVSKIGEVTNGMNTLAKGDRNFVLTGHDRKDEFGDMVNTLELFKHANRKMEIWSNERAERAEEKAREQEEREHEREEHEQRRTALLHEVAQQFEHTIGDVVSGVAAASSELQVTAAKMASSAEQSSHRTNEVAQSMQEANSGATAAAAASDEFALSIGEISRQASSSSELARLASDATVEADTTISELSESAEQVGHIVELIQTIAKRTNLLALNASIEAARGGEAGRGFAVVASEVKELANQTSRATEQIAEQIRSMQTTTGASVSALRAIAGQVRDLESTAISIASAVDQQSVAGQDLARSIDIASRGTDEVAGHVEDVRELSLSTGAAASQVLTSATELEEQASTLTQHVDSFLKRVREA